MANSEDRLSPDDLPEAMKAELEEKREMVSGLFTQVPLDREAVGEEIIEYKALNNGTFYNIQKNDTAPGMFVIHGGRTVGAYYNIQKNDTAPVMFAIHGGGYYTGAAYDFAKAYVPLATAAGFNLFNVEYDLAPEFPVYELTRNCLTAYEYLTEERKVPADQIVLYGESAGGGLVSYLLNALRGPDTKHEGNPDPPYFTASEPKAMPRGALIVSPWVDLEMTQESYKNHTDPVLTWFWGNGTDISAWRDRWVPWIAGSKNKDVIRRTSIAQMDVSGWSNARIVHAGKGIADLSEGVGEIYRTEVSPMDATDILDAPRTQVGSIEPLLDECVEIGKRLEKAPGSSYEVFKDVPHCGMNLLQDPKTQKLIDAFHANNAKWMNDLFKDDAKI